MREFRRRGWTVRLSLVVLVPRDLSGRRRLTQLAQDTITRRAFQAHWFWPPANARAAAEWLGGVRSEPLFVEQLYIYPFVPRRAIARGDAGIGRRLEKGHSRGSTGR